MPIPEMPLEQLVVALATKWTGEESVLPLPGEDTDTPANAHTLSVSTEKRVFILSPAINPAFASFLASGTAFQCEKPGEVAKHSRPATTYLQATTENS